MNGVKVSLAHNLLLRMVIDNFHIKGILVAPHEANTPLIIDTYTVLSRSIALQLLKPI